MRDGWKPGDTIDQLRGSSPERRQPDDMPYSAVSYCAQYGVPLEEARDIVVRCVNHGQAVRMINAFFIERPDELKRALDV